MEEGLFSSGIHVWDDMPFSRIELYWLMDNQWLGV